jgi:hypothetical protein
MTIITPNSISGINSITAQSNSLNFYTTAGSTLSIGASVSGNITGNVTGNLTGNVNSSGVSTVTTLRATSIVGVTTAGITTAYIGSVNDGPISGARNRIINGDMQIDVRNSGASVTTSALQTGTYTLDRWFYYSDVVSKRTIQRSGIAPVGFTSSLAVTVIATDTSGPQQFLQQPIEGYNISDFAWGTSSAKPATLSFWVRSSVIGQHGGSIQNNGTTRSFPFAYTINSQNTWEYKTINIGGETTGTWVTDNGIGLRLLFEHGPGYQNATAGSWVTTNTTSSTGSVNLCATNGATWYITGVQLEPGTVATPFERRLYGQELALCQRYYQVLYNGPWRRYVANVDRDQRQMAVPMRRIPILTMSASGVNLNANGTSATSTHFIIDLQYTGGGSGVIDLASLSIVGSAEL